MENVGKIQPSDHPQFALLNDSLFSEVLCKSVLFQTGVCAKSQPFHQIGDRMRLVDNLEAIGVNLVFDSLFSAVSMKDLRIGLRVRYWNGINHYTGSIHYSHWFNNYRIEWDNLKLMPMDVTESILIGLKKINQQSKSKTD